MNRPKMVRSIYAEFRHAAADEGSPEELLRAATGLVDLLKPLPQSVASGMSFRTGGLSFEEWDLDRAMADGGWRVLRHERELEHIAFGDEGESLDRDREVAQWMRENVA